MHAKVSSRTQSVEGGADRVPAWEDQEDADEGAHRRSPRDRGDAERLDDRATQARRSVAGRGRSRTCGKPSSSKASRGALVRRKRATTPTPKLLDGAAEAKLIAMRLGKPPVGFVHWKLRLLADRMGEREVVESISPEAVRQTKKFVTQWREPLVGCYDWRIGRLFDVAISPDSTLAVAGGDEGDFVVAWDIE